MGLSYGHEPTQAEAGRGPAEIEFNALWDKGYVPTIKSLGYDRVRAVQQLVFKVCSEQGVTVAVARLESIRTQKAFERFGLHDALPKDRVFHSVDEAVRAHAK